MPEALLSTLHGGIEIAFLIALLSACLRGGERRGLALSLKWGAVLGISAGLVLTWGVVSGLDREAVELAVNGIAAVLLVVLVFWFAGATGDVSKVGGLIVFSGAAVLTALPALDIGLTQARAFISEEGSAAGLAGGGLVLAGAGLAGMALHRVTARARPITVTWTTMLVLSILFIRDTTTVLQIALLKGMIPWTDWLFSLVVPLVNYFGVFFYAFLASTAVLALLGAREWRRSRNQLDGLNPAEKRKRRVVSRRTATVFTAFGLVLLLVVLNDGASVLLANRPPQLSPATAVSADHGHVMVPGEALADGKLHRFAFATNDGVSVRFIMAHKGSGIYGVGLDACEFCGVAGYRQEKDNVICNRCGAAINKTTIGFPGGCNPVPLPYDKPGEAVAINVAALEAVKGIFAR